MTTATITPIGGGRVVLEIDGATRPFPSWMDAADEARACGRRPVLERFKPTPLVVELIAAT